MGNASAISPEHPCVVDLIFRRLSARRRHFASRRLLASQFEALEEPLDLLTLSSDEKPVLATRIEGALGLEPSCRTKRSLP